MTATYQQSMFGGVEQTELTSDDYYTPAWVFDALGVTFDLDPASPPGGPPFVPTRNFYTKADDGLAQPWHGLVWMNPPFSKTTPWVDRWLDHGNGVALLPCAKSGWFYNLWSRCDVAVVALGDARFQFHRSDSNSGSIFLPVVVAAIGDGTKANLAALGRVR